MERMGILHISRAEYPSLGEEIFNLLELVQLPVVWMVRQESFLIKNKPLCVLCDLLMDAFANNRWRQCFAAGSEFHKMRVYKSSPFQDNYRPAW